MADRNRKTIVFSERQWKWFSKCWGFTKREVDVLRLVCQGKSYEQIGKDLGIAHSTATTLMGRVFKRIGVNDRLGAVIELIKRSHDTP